MLNQFLSKTHPANLSCFLYITLSIYSGWRNRAVMKVICIGLVIMTVLLASSLAIPRKPYARKQYANYLQEEKDLMQKEMAAAVARNAFGRLNAREH